MRRWLPEIVAWDEIPSLQSCGAVIPAILDQCCLNVYPDACSDVPPPLRSRGGLGWGASAASGKSLTLPHGFLLSEAVATFGCTLKDKQPHPSPPLLSQGRGQIPASLVPLNLNTLCEAHS